MYYNHLLSKNYYFIHLQNKYLIFRYCFVNLLILLLLLFALSTLTISFDNNEVENVHTALAFKATVPSDQNENLQQQKQQEEIYRNSKDSKTF